MTGTAAPPRAPLEFGAPVWQAGGLGLFGLVMLAFGVSPVDYLKFLVGLLLLVYLPGRALLRLLRIRDGRLENMLFALVTGMAAATVINKFTRWFDLEFLFVLWIGLGLVSSLIELIGRLRAGPIKSRRFRLTRTGGIIGLILLLMMAGLAVDNYRNARMREDGSRIIHLHYYDGFYRNAVTRELTHTVPPRVPAAAELPLGYHYGMDLFAAMFARYLDLDVFDLHHRMLISFFFLILVLALFVFIRTLTRSEGTALLGTALTLFGSGGLAYLVTWLQGLNQWGNLFFTFYFFNITTVNSFLPGLAVLLTGWTALILWLRAPRTGRLVSAALLLALSMEFKQFFIGPVIGALILAGLILWLAGRGTALLKAGLLTTLLALPLLCAAFAHNTGAIPYRFRFRFVDWVIFSLQELKPPLLYLTWKGVLQHARFSFINCLLTAAGGLTFLLGAFGLNLIALPGIVRDWFRVRRTPPERYVLITFFGGCVLYFFTIQLVLGGRPRNFVNIYAFFLAFIMLAVFWSEKLIHLLKGKKRALRAVVIGAALLLAVPNTLRYLRIKVLTPQPRIFSAAFLEAADWINHGTPPETVILHPLELRYVCYFADRRVVLDFSSHSYITFHLTASQIEKRTGQIAAFFQRPELRAADLDRLGADYVWTWNDPDGSEPWASGGPVQGYTDLGTTGIRKFRRSHVLEPVFTNAEFRIYRVVRIPKEKAGIFVLDEAGGGFGLIPFGKYRERR